MSKNKPNDIKYKIISSYYNDEFDDRDKDKIKKVFISWLVNEKDSDAKDLALKKIWDTEVGTPLSEEKLNEIKQSVKERIYTKETSTPKTGRKISLGKRLGRIAAVIIPLFIIGGVWLYTSSDKSTEQNWITAYGEIEQVTLSDNSEMWINAGSTIDLTKDKAGRVAELSGESYFKIEKQSHQTFKVVASDVTITVTGTEFNVQAYPNNEKIIVALIKGSVEVTLPTEQLWKMHDNQQFIYDKKTQQATLIDTYNIEDDASWREGIVVCKEQSLTEILNAIERKFNVTIILTPQFYDNTDIKYTINFDSSETPNSVMEALDAMIDGFSYELVDSTTFQIGGQTEI